MAVLPLAKSAFSNCLGDSVEDGDQHKVKSGDVGDYDAVSNELQSFLSWLKDICYENDGTCAVSGQAGMKWAWGASTAACSFGSSGPGRRPVHCANGRHCATESDTSK
ncbi:hypothetical protein HPP92_028887 [Vanilla planifolia]|uniref:Uncharacterized protein n=1 Tax=Vanilla planifolia TaxID=51239 RepID=A0A835U2D6_VANPL|nr:hypothetical protein HPP92_028887 [Vanilla planifolia]KAG0446348.1 hypothetical protein HPP92_028876 [Vanilla planifolia]